MSVAVVEIIAFLQWCLHDFWRFIGAAILIRAVFSWRLIDLKFTRKTVKKDDES